MMPSWSMWLPDTWKLVWPDRPSSRQVGLQEVAAREEAVDLVVGLARPDSWSLYVSQAVVPTSRG